LFSAGHEVGKPYPTLAPACRFEICGPNQDKLVYDVCPYDAGPDILVWHNGRMLAVTMDKMKSWCANNGIDFDKNIGQQKKAIDGDKK
jgi:hypothetical protein